MSYFESLNESNSILKKILILLKPLGIVTGAGSNRLNVDVTTVTGVTTVTTVTTVGTVTTLANQTNIGTVNAYQLAKDTARNAYSNSIRANITF
jgi:hypothetical protein